MELAGTTVKRADNVLRRRLQQSHNIGDKFVFALDIGQDLQVLFANIYGFFHVCALEQGQRVIFLTELLDELGGSIARIAQQQCGLAVQKVIQTAIVQLALSSFFIVASLLLGYTFGLDFDTGTHST